MPKQRLRQNQHGQVVVQQFNSRLLTKWDTIARFATVSEATTSYPAAKWRGPIHKAQITEAELQLADAKV